MATSVSVYSVGVGCSLGLAGFGVGVDQAPPWARVDPWQAAFRRWLDLLLWPRGGGEKVSPCFSRQIISVLFLARETVTVSRWA